MISKKITDEGETGMNNQSKLIDNEDIKMQYKDTINLQKKYIARNAIYSAV